MKSRIIHDAQGQRTYVVVLDQGDEAMQSLQSFAEAESLAAAQVTAIGAFQSAIVGFWNWESREYEQHRLPEQTEALSLLGDIAVDPEGNPKLHLHAVLAGRSGVAVGGHLLEGYVRPTMEVIVTESPAYLRRVYDADVGLALIEL